MEGKLISISTNKGGAGKTTIATNLACCIAQKHPLKKVCLIDVDGQCGVSIIFGKAPQNFINNSILTLIEQKIDVNDILYNDIEYIDKDKKTQKLDNLFIIFSEPNLKGFDHLINKNIQLMSNFKAILKSLKKQFDIVIIDTPPAMSTINMLVLQESDFVVSPFEPERQNIEGSIAILNELQKNEYKTKPIIYFLPIKVKMNTIIDKALLEYVETIVSTTNYHKLKLSNFFIPSSTQYKSVSAKERTALILSKSKTKAVQIQKELIQNIAEDILELLTNKKI